jgi:hypothetical protein
MEGEWLWIAVVVVQVAMGGLVACQLWEASRAQHHSDP